MHSETVKFTQILVYACDVITVGRSIDALKETLKKLMKVFQVMGITINTKKTKEMEVIKKPVSNKMLKIYGQK